MRRRDIILTAAAMPFILGTARLNGAFAQDAAVSDTIATSAGDVTIIPVNHASLILSFNGQAIYADPVGGAEPYASHPKPTAILVTHIHKDHFDLATLEAIAGDAPLIVNQEVFEALSDGLKAKATVLANGASGTIVDIPVEAVAAYNITEDRKKYHPQGIGNGYVLTLGDKRVYIAGDTEDVPEMRALKDIALAFLPMNLPFTMTAEQAADAAKAFKPAVVYPYHFGGKDLPQTFAKLMEGSGVEVRLAKWY